MSTVAKLLARKQALLERLESGPGPNERESLKWPLDGSPVRLNPMAPA